MQGAKCALANASILDAFDPRARFFCAFSLAIVCSFLRSPSALILGSVVPFALLFTGDRASLLRTLRRVNLAGVFVCLLLPLTYPGERMWGFFSLDGLLMGMLVMYRLNLISIVMHRLVVSLGVARIHDILAAVRAPEKLRILLLLTMRHISILADRAAMMRRAVALRGAGLPWRLACYAFACGIGSAMVHGQDRAERSRIAIECRGGFGGFSQYGAMAWRRRDSLLCAACALYLVAIACTVWGEGAAFAQLANLA